MHLKFEDKVMSKQRYYYRKSYTGSYSAFGTAFVFALVGVISLIFRYTDIDFIGLADWGYWLFIPAFFIALGAFKDYFNDSRLRKHVLLSLQNTTGNRINLDQFSKEIGIKPNGILRVLVDLRVKGLIKYSYDSNTGEILLGESIQYRQAPEFVEPPSKKQLEVIFPSSETEYCPYCGHKAISEAQFCENCGSKLP